MLITMIDTRRDYDPLKGIYKLHGGVTYDVREPVAREFIRDGCARAATPEEALTAEEAA